MPSCREISGASTAAELDLSRRRWKRRRRGAEAADNQNPAPAAVITAPTPDRSTPPINCPSTDGPDLFADGRSGPLQTRFRPYTQPAGAHRRAGCEHVGDVRHRWAAVIQGAADRQPHRGLRRAASAIRRIGHGQPSGRRFGLRFASDLKTLDSNGTHRTLGL